MSRILEKMKKLVSKLPEAEQDEFFEFVASMGEQEQPPEQAKETEAEQAEETPQEPTEPPEPDASAAEPTQEPSTQEPPTQEPTQAAQPPLLQTEPQPSPEQDAPEEDEFYEGKVEDIPQIVKSETDESAIYDPNADNVEMHGGEGEQEDSIAKEPPQEETNGAEQGDIVASLTAKITALEAENAQMKAKFGANFGYGNAPSLAKGRYQTKEDFIRSLPQVRKG